MKVALVVIATFANGPGASLGRLFLMGPAQKNFEKREINGVWGDLRENLPSLCCIYRHLLVSFCCDIGNGDQQRNLQSVFWLD